MSESFTDHQHEELMAVLRQILAEMKQANKTLDSIDDGVDYKRGR